MRSSITLLLILFTLQSVKAQPTVRFDKGTDLCEHAVWKLVWSDEFSSTSLDTRKWYTFIDNENWADGRVADPPIAAAARNGEMVIYKDKNVTVRDGYCQLHLKYDPDSFLGGYRNFSSGMIMARNPNASQPLYFNRGKYEIRARLPVTPGVWATFWLFGGGAPNVNKTEIDMFEYNPCASRLKELPYHIHGNHRGPEHKTHYEVTGRTKSKTLNDWHVYTTEWDRNFIRLYMDGELRGSVRRYASDCNPDINKQYTEDPDNVFPRQDEFMKLIVNFDYTKDMYTRNFLGICTPIPGWLANREKWDARQPERIFEIDYVRVYQRTGEVQENLR